MNALAPIQPALDYTGQQIALIKRTVASDTNPSEFDLFMEVARRTRLDPFRKQISALVFSKDDPVKRKMAIITTIDGLRAIAARTRLYRPDEEEAEYTFDDPERSPTNPLGLVKAVVTIWIADAMRQGGWKPVKGWAYWDEFAPIKEEVEGGFDWVDTGEVWPDSGKAKKRKVPRNADAKVIRQLDTSGNWGRMPRVMLAKCAEAQALRKAFPEDMSGLYERAEFDQAGVIDLTATEIMEATETESKLLRLGVANAITFQLLPTAPLEPIPLGQVADRVLDSLRDYDMPQLRWFESANRSSLQEFWARAKADALGLKSAIEKRRAELELAAEKAPAP